MDDEAKCLKICSVIRSCKRIDQIMTAIEWSKRIKLDELSMDFIEAVAQDMFIHLMGDTNVTI